MKHAIRAACCAAVLLFCTRLCPAQAQTLELSWDAPASAAVAGYRIHFGTASGMYDVSTDIGASTSYTFADPRDGTMHYIALTAYTADGSESPLSREIAFYASAPEDPQPEDPVNPQEPDDPGTPGVTLITGEPQIATADGQFRDLSTDPFSPTELSAGAGQRTIIRWTCAFDLIAFALRHTRGSMPAPYLHMWQFRLEGDTQWHSRPVNHFLWWAWIVDPQELLDAGSYEFRTVVADSSGNIDYSATYYLLVN